FHLFKVESQPEIKKCKSISQFTQFFNKYVNWYNNDRISNKTKNMSPVDYRTRLSCLKVFYFCLTFLLHFTSRVFSIFHLVK
ncbi:MAG TPA: IS3 family transposase, partial [Candidatus Scybalomonas excrementigallinarum]|nr:IS3 family transposase [Candidatus Scybalomonas excrementigallinarum]